MNKVLADKPVIMLGSGGHASVLMDIMLQQNREVIAIVSPETKSKCGVFQGIDVLPKDEAVFQYSAREVKLVNGIGFMPASNKRHDLFHYFKQAGYEFSAVIADSAEVSPFATVGEGVQILHGSIIQANSCLGENTIINSGTVVEHDCQIGPHNHIAPGAVICGGVTTGKGVFLGSNSTITQNTQISADTIVGAGAVVSNNVVSSEPDNQVIVYPPRSNVKVAVKGN